MEKTTPREQNAIIEMDETFLIESRPPPRTAGEAMDTIFLDTFYDFPEYLDLMQAEHETGIAAFHSRSQRKIHLIPKENVSRPKPHMLRSLTAVANFCVEDEDLLEMLSGLCASAFNKTKNIHPRHFELLRSLSSPEAQFLLSFRESAAHKAASFLNNKKRVASYTLNPESKANQAMPVSENLFLLGLLDIVEIYETLAAAGTDPAWDKLSKLVKKSYGEAGLREIRGDIIMLSPTGKAFMDICT